MRLTSWPRPFGCGKRRVRRRDWLRRDRVYPIGGAGRDEKTSHLFISLSGNECPSPSPSASAKAKLIGCETPLPLERHESGFNLFGALGKKRQFRSSRHL